VTDSPPMSPPLLHYREYGRLRAWKPSLLFLHGLFGSAANWRSIARHFEADWHVVVPDLRNHGESFHDEQISYPLMSEDLRLLVDHLALPQVVPVGHSMGGKVAMTLALRQPDGVAALGVVDIAPVAYPNRFASVLNAMAELERRQPSDRRQATDWLARCVGDRGVAAYLLQNLRRDAAGRWRWRLNLSALSRHIDAIGGFPGDLCTHPPRLPAAFIHGTRSEYLDSEGQAAARRCFPLACFYPIPEAGHWVYAERPEAFVHALNGFLADTV